MKRLLWVLAVCLAASVSAQESQLAQVTGVGSSQQEAVSDGFRRAIEKISGSVMLSTQEASGRKLTKEEVAKYSAGYIDRYKITDVSKTKTDVVVSMDVWVKPSKMAYHKVDIASDQAPLDGPRVGAQIKSFQDEKKQSDAFLSQTLEDYPYKAFTLKQSEPVIQFDKDRDAIITMDFIVEWNYNYLNSLKEAFSLVTADVKRPEYKVWVRSRAQGKWIADDDVFYINDRNSYLKIANSISEQPTVTAVFYDTQNRQIDSRCFGFGDEYSRTTPDGMFQVIGTARSWRTLNIKVDAKSSLSKNISEVDKIVLKITTRCIR
jgi:hypothetical protein